MKLSARARVFRNVLIVARQARLHLSPLLLAGISMVASAQPNTRDSAEDKDSTSRQESGSTSASFEQMRLPGDRVFQRTSDSEWQLRKQAQSPSQSEEVEATPHPFYERFSNYIRQTTGRRVLGTLPFSHVGILNAKLPDHYVVGSGDQIEIQVWGTVNANYNLTVDASGRVFVPEIGSIQVQGAKNVDLSALLSGQFQRVYKGFELRALVSAARSVDMIVTGQAQTIGQRSVPSSISVVAAALAYVRPTEGGSRRFVELRRSGRTQLIDLYCFANGRCNPLPTVLQDGDVLHVPPRAPLLAITGAVNRPGIYELDRGEGLLDALQYAGGLSIEASTSAIDLYSFAPSPVSGPMATAGQRQFKSVDVRDVCGGPGSEPASCHALQDGDFLEIKPVLGTVRGSVTVTAAGVEPLRFTWRPGLRLSDVVKQPLTRFLSNEIITQVNKGDFRSINELDERLPEIDLESVTVYRLNPESRGYESISADAQAALRGEPGNVHDIPMNDGDVVTLDTKAVWKTPRDSMTASVRVLGEVKRPGRFRYVGTRTLAQVLAQAGGSTEQAAIWGTVVLRQDDSRASLNRQMGVSVLRNVINHQAKQELASNPAAAAGASANVSPPVTLPQSTELARLIGNRSVVFVDAADSSGLMLAPGDIVVVPPMQQTIGCYGAVFRQGELALGADNIASSDGVRRCGIVDEMSPTVYQFSVRDGSVCRHGWLSRCGELRGGDFLVAVPDSVRKRGVAAFMEFLDGIYRAALAVATIKVLSQ
jgi:protein involved in polysaccharide export with SLBB domain